MKKRELREQFVPWAGLVVAVIGIGVAHQFGSEATFHDCEAASPGPLLIVTLAAIAVTSLAALASWRVVSDRNQGAARRLVGIVSVGAAALLVFATLLPMIASLVLPPCFQ
jgi:hypothetical protein